MTSSAFDRQKQELAAELRADVVAGRGQIPRGRDGRPSPAFLEAARGQLVPLAAVVAEQLARLAPPVKSRSTFDGLEGAALELARLEQLEGELRELLETSAPRVWDDIRRPLYRLLRRARLELRRTPARH